MMEPNKHSFYVRTSNPLMARWQASVMKTITDRIQQEQPNLPMHQLQSLAMKDAMMTGMNLHVAEHNSSPAAGNDGKPPSFADIAADTETIHIKHYQASKHFYNLAIAGQVPILPHLAAEVIIAATTDNKPGSFPDTDANLLAWVKAARDWAQFSNPFPSPYIDWETRVPAGANKEDFRKTFAVYTIPDDAKIVILGDFGTGLIDGILMLMSILINQQPDFIIHVGDIYYAGMDSETDAYVNMFTEAFARTGKKIPVFSIPGNHEYMCGGAPFYNKVLRMNADNGFPQYAQTASYFCLRNTSGTLQFLSMDTGLNAVDSWLPYTFSGAYAPWLWFSEAEWCVDKLETFKASGGKTILLSHHQLYSVSGQINDSNNVVYVTNIKEKERNDLEFLNGNLLYVFAPYFDQIAAWYWGHEHLLGIYQDNELKNEQGVPLKKARLVGNSGYEQWDKNAGYDPPKEKGLADNSSDEQSDKNVVPTPPINRFHYASPLIKVGLTSVKWTDHILGGPIKISRESTFYNHGWALLNVKANTITASYWQFPIGSPDIIDLPPINEVPPPMSVGFEEEL